MADQQFTNGKRFKDYLLEGLMIFVAVTLGFIAESIGENMNDRKREREYITSLISNLEQDTAQFKRVIRDNKRKMVGLDSLLSLSPGIMDASAKRLLYQFAGPYVSEISIFLSNDATMLQLKNSGGLQFIKRAHIADSIVFYDLLVRGIYAAEVPYQTSIKDAIDAMTNVLILRIGRDSSYYKGDQYTSKELPLLTLDNREIEVLFNKISMSHGWTYNYLDKLERFYPYSIKLVELLRREYGIKSPQKPPR